jgi:hypothetical protein
MCCVMLGVMCVFYCKRGKEACNMLTELHDITLAQSKEVTTLLWVASVGKSYCFFQYLWPDLAAPHVYC